MPPTGDLLYAYARSDRSRRQTSPSLMHNLNMLDVVNPIYIEIRFQLSFLFYFLFVSYSLLFYLNQLLLHPSQSILFFLYDQLIAIINCNKALRELSNLILNMHSFIEDFYLAPMRCKSFLSYFRMLDQILGVASLMKVVVKVVNLRL